MSKHTPTSTWVLDGLTIKRTGTHTSDQDDICYMNDEGGNESSEWFADPAVVLADAEFIFRAAKCHEELLDALMLITETADAILNESHPMHNATFDASLRPLLIDNVRISREVIAAVRED